MIQIEVIEPGFELITPISEIKELPKRIELAGRTCYKSEDKITDDSASRFIKSLVKSGHHSVLEHCSITVRVICDRACSHQLVRHRLASFSQESQRYCDYSKGSQEYIQVICPPTIGLHPGVYRLPHDDIFHVEYRDKWLEIIWKSYQTYRTLRSMKIPPEDARSVLPNATKTEIVISANLRQWRHIFNERALNQRAQWQIREITQGILKEIGILLPDVFGDQLEKLHGN